MQFAWQIFDGKVLHLLRDEYRIKRVTKVRADTLEELVQKLDDVNAGQGARDHQGLQRRREEGSCRSIPTSRTAAARSAWRSRSPTGPTSIDTPPLRGLRRHLRHHLHLRRPEDRQLGARRSDTDGQVIPGLYAAGELVGGLFYFNYPGGTGLMNGAVFGRIAGTTAGQRAAQVP